jgi:hypothetical protein
VSTVYVRSLGDFLALATTTIVAAGRSLAHALARSDRA